MRGSGRNGKKGWQKWDKRAHGGSLRTGRVLEMGVLESWSRGLLLSELHRTQRDRDRDRGMSPGRACFLSQALKERGGRLGPWGPSWASPPRGLPPPPPGPRNMRAEEAGGWASAVVSLPVPILRLLPPGVRGLCPAGNECPLSGPGARPASGHYQGAGGPRSSAAAPLSRPRWPDVAPPPRQPEPGGGVRSRIPGI